MRSEAADIYFKSGEYWKAKKILQGKLSQKLAFDPDLLVQYGDVLLAMGDLIEAGRYLFASGIRKPEYSEAIAVFLSQKSGNSPQQLWSAMPSMLRRESELAMRIVTGGGFAETGFDTKTFESLRERSAQIRSDFNPLKTSHLTKLKEIIFGICFFAGFIVLSAFSITLGIKIAQHTWKLLSP